MGWFDGFPFKSKEKMLQEQKEFETRVFPLGPEQKECARKALVPLLKTKKLKDNEKLFAFISARDSYTLVDGRGEAGLRAAAKRLKDFRWFTDEDAQIILSLIDLDDAVTSLDEYPTSQEILAHIPQLDF